MRWLLIMLVSSVALAGKPGRFDRFNLDNRRTTRGLEQSSLAAFEFAPLSGAGMGTACACTTPTGAKGEALAFQRASVGECYSNDGQSLTQCPTDKPRVSSGSAASSVLGLWSEWIATNSITRSRDLSQAVWTKTNMTCAKTATGMRADANGASTCTATGAAATVCQTVTTASAPRASSWHIKRRTGTGAVTLARDGATYSSDISASLSSTLWRRAVPNQAPGCAGGNCIVVSQLTGSVLNPQVCLKLATSGDAVDIDFVQDEAVGLGGVVAYATSPIETAAAAAARQWELGTFTPSGLSSIDSIGSMTMTVLTESPDGSGEVPGMLYLSASGNIYVNTNAHTVLLNDGTLAATLSDVTSTGTATTYAGQWKTGYSMTMANLTAGTSATAAFDGSMNSSTIALGNRTTGVSPLQGVIKQFAIDPNPYRYVSGVVDWIGDSIVFGTGGLPAAPTALQSQSGRIVVNYGVAGRTTVTCASAYNTVYNITNSQTVIWSCAINDINAGTTGATAAANSIAVFNDARSRGKNVVVTSIMPWKGTAGWSAGDITEGHAYDALVQAWAVANGQKFVSLASMGGEGGDPDTMLAAYDSGDHLHPNSTGAAAMAALVLAAGLP